MKPFVNKSLFVVSLILVGSLFFSSCHKDINEPVTATIPLIAAIYGYSDNDSLTSTISFQYDDKGRLIKLDQYLGYTMMEYSESAIVFRNFVDGVLKDTSIIQLNNKGICTSSSMNNSNEQQTYEYNNDGYLISTFFEDNNWMFTSNNTVLEGNYVTTISTEVTKTTNPASVKEVGFLNNSFLTTIQDKRITLEKKLKSAALDFTSYSSKSHFQFYKDQLNTIDFENMGFSFYGKQNKNPIKQETNTTTFDSDPSETITVTYTYMYDTKGRITRQTSSYGYYSIYTYVN